MAKLRDKLNVLVQSGLRGALPGDRPKRRKPSDLDRQVSALRAEIDQALEAEDQMTSAIAALDFEIQTWDQQADAALQRGDEAGARHAVHQMQLAQQRKGLLEADLAQHRYTTSDLIRRVNTLEAVLAESRTTNASTPPAAAKDRPAEDRAHTEQRSARLSEDIAVAQSAPAAIDDSATEQAIEDDLARRRARLSL